MRAALVVGGVGLGVGAWLGVRPVGPPTEEVPAPASSSPCPPNTVALGLPPIEEGPVDPGLDPELVGRPVARPPSVGSEWSEASLERALAGTGAVLYCDEWPCIVEIEAPRSDADPYGLEVTAELERRLAAAGLDGSLTGVTSGAPDGRPGWFGRYVLTPWGWWPDPNTELRTAVRLFWLGEGELP
jgi:hypothetical protein